MQENGRVMKEKGGAAAAMNGLEKITGQILAQAREEAKKIEHQSAEEAEKIRACAEKEAEAWEEKAVSSLERELEELRNRESSKRDQERSRAVLEAKQEIVRDLIGKARKKMRETDEKEYFGALKTIFFRCVRGECGVMFLGSRDYQRMPGNFEKEIKKIARETGGVIELREDPSIADGFLLSYGGIEENCTLDALFAGRWNELQDVVNDRLWRESDGR